MVPDHSQLLTIRSPSVQDQIFLRVDAGVLLQGLNRLLETKPEEVDLALLLIIAVLVLYSESCHQLATAGQLIYCEAPCIHPPADQPTFQPLEAAARLGRAKISSSRCRAALVPNSLWRIDVLFRCLLAARSDVSQAVAWGGCTNSSRAPDLIRRHQLPEKRAHIADVQKISEA